MARAKLLTLTEFGNPILEHRAKRVPRSYLKTKECAQLIRDMIATMRKTRGVGLAAPQIGVPLQITVMEVRPTANRPELPTLPVRVVINPKILSYNGTLTKKWEGCLSFKLAFGQVPRYAGVLVEYMDEHGEMHTEKATGLLAHIFQHEVDHLQGIRYIDRMEDLSSLMTEGEYRKKFGKPKST